MTVRQLRRETDLAEMVDWQGYQRYKAALEDQAREKAAMSQDAKRQAAQRHGRQRRRS
jgi:hypothetical protein